MAKAKATGSQLGIALAEAIGVAPNDCLRLTLDFKPGDFVTITALVVCRDEQEKIIVEDDDLKVANRTFTEGEVKRIHMFDDARDQMAPPLYERIDETKPTKETTDAFDE